VDVEDVATELEKEGVAAFADSYDRLIKALHERRYAVTQAYAAT
jgi:hypothetical protein